MRPTVQLSNGCWYRLDARGTGLECTFGAAWDWHWQPMAVSWTLDDVRALASLLEPPDPMYLLRGQRVS